MNQHSLDLQARAIQVIPGGVNSPVRAFNAVGGKPRFVRSAKGSWITDVDGQTYLDYVGSWGPMILGHAHPAILAAVEAALADGLSFGASTEREVQMAELLVELVEPLEKVRMVNSGTEAVMSALRLARGYTGRDKIIKFAGCYHGHSDSMLVKAGSGALTGGQPDSLGVTAGTAADTLVAVYNDLDSVRLLLDLHPGEVAAIIVEPVAANMGVVPPAPDFLPGLRQLCDTQGCLLIFDEVITGFRLALGGAQQYFNVTADLVTYGKIIGGGLPVGAYGGRRDIMDHIAPLGGVYQAGTLSGNPLAMAAGLATLTTLQEDPGLYERIGALGQRLADGLRAVLPYTVNQVGSLVCPFFTTTPVDSFATAISSDTSLYADYFQHMLAAGIWLAPAQFEAMFIAGTHREVDIDRTVAAAADFAKNHA
jgi:glutamate-1-semialdehyde 2,1-aminomutase